MTAPSLHNRGSDPQGPYPSVGGALMLTLMALLAAGFTGIAFIDFGVLTAIGVGQAIGVGAVATLGAQRVAEPQAARLGLRALDLEAVPMILCLVPAILLASELDNIAADWSGLASPVAIESHLQSPEESSNGFSLEGPADALGEGDARDVSGFDGDGDPISNEFDLDHAAETPLREERTSIDEFGDGSDVVRNDSGETTDAEDETHTKLIDFEDPVSVIQAFVVIVGISPVVEEFLFRGVIQQGLLQRLGLLRGVSVVALFWTLLRPAPIADAARFAAAALASFALGWALGLVRIATGSILGSILLASGWAAVGLSATILENKFPLPGLNVEGTHLPIMVTIASAGIVGWAGWTMFREAELKFAEGDAEPSGPSPND